MRRAVRFRPLGLFTLALTWALGGLGCGGGGISIESLRITNVFVTEALVVETVILNDYGTPEGRLLTVELFREEPTMERELVLETSRDDIVNIPAGRFEADVGLGIVPMAAFDEDPMNGVYVVRLTIEGEASATSPRMPLLAP